MRDEYLNPLASLLRLIKEYKQYKNLVVAFDFDNTVYDFHGKGLVYEEVPELLRELKSIGCYLTCFTANSNTELIIKTLKDLNIEYDSINENPPFFKCDERKIYYNILLDDRAGLRECYDQLKNLLYIIKNENKSISAD